MDAATAARRGLASLTNREQHTSGQSVTETPSTSPLTDTLLRRFWERMAALFGHTWASQYGTEASGVAAETWASALAGVTGPQLAAGMRETLKRGNAWPPSAPEFRAMCLGVPSMAECKIDMRAATEDRRPFTRLLWQFLDGYTFARADQDRAERMLRDAYDLAKAHVMGGGALPEAGVALTYDADAERRLYDEQHMQRLRELAAEAE